MKITILIPHFKTGKMTAYTISQLLKHKGEHELNIVVIDNNAGDGSVKYLEPFSKHFTYLPYPNDRLQSHGIAFDFALELNYVNTGYFITLESDSFPIQDGWLDYYEYLVSQEVDCAGSILQLSGGSYLHPAGALYKKSNWDKAIYDCSNIPYAYLPNIATKEGFDSHLMVHDSIFAKFMKNPDDYIELSSSYKPYVLRLGYEKLAHYSPIGLGVFHNGMGNRQESIKTFRDRSIASEADTLTFDNKQKLIYRIGAEPGQWFSWWHAHNKKSINSIPTEIKWLPGKENQQQEYTLNEAGIKHLWAISAYHGYTPENERDVALLKQSIPDLLYETLPSSQKI